MKHTIDEIKKPYEHFMLLINGRWIYITQEKLLEHLNNHPLDGTIQTKITREWLLDEPVVPKEGQKWKNKNTGQYMKIKEITYFFSVKDIGNSTNRIAYIVCSGECQYMGYTNTNVERFVLNRYQLLARYEYVKE